MILIRELVSFLKERIKSNAVFLTRNNKLLSVGENLSNLKISYDFELYLTDLSKKHDLSLQLYLRDFFKAHPRATYSVGFDEQKEGGEEDFFSTITGKFEEYLSLEKYTSKPSGRELKDSFYYKEEYYKISLISNIKGI